MTERVPEILFVCVQNAGRSQMAAAFAQALGGEGVVVRSAGSAPAEAVHAPVAAAMLEVGIDLRESRPKRLTDEAVVAADVVISMGCGDACPVYPGKRYLDWELDDPGKLDMDGVRLVRDEIRGRVAGLLGELGVPLAGL